MPRGTGLTITESSFGSYEIGDIEGWMHLYMKGSGSVTAGRMAATVVNLSGSGSLDMAAVNGREFNARISGAGNITVREGQVNDLTAKVSGHRAQPRERARYPARARWFALSPRPQPEPS